MLDLIQTATTVPTRPPLADVNGRPGGQSVGGWWAGAIDQIDIGMLLLDANARVLFANRAARAELAQAEHPLQQLGGELRARRSADATALRGALRDACTRSLRRLLTLAQEQEPLHVAVLPLRDADTVEPLCLMLLGQRGGRVPMAVHCFAHAHALTSAEDQVLQALYRGLTPRQIARSHGVALSTVRTQLASIRAKTCCVSLRELLLRLALLPPMAAAFAAAA
ncbi:MAG: helix-turn-helix transcriptional regulator [Proteobacteria bacterium]|nr:helix-turn-helix transcriptional regulator [Pseudomonadota bacterium]